MARKSNTISIVQIDAGRVVHLRVKRTPRSIDPATFTVANLGDDTSPAAGFKAFAKTHRIAEDDVCLVLPRHTLTSRMLVLPSQDPDEIKGMVTLSAGEYVPYPANEIVVDQAILQRLADGHSRVLAVFAHRDTVEEQVDWLRQAGIEAEHILVSTACLAAAAIEGRKGNDERFAIVHLAPGGLEILILNGGRVEYSRGIAVAQSWPEHTQDNAEAIEELAVELRTSLAAYRRESEDGQGVDTVYVSSDCVQVGGIADALAGITGLEVAPARFAQTLMSHTDAVGGLLPMVSLGAAVAAQDRSPIRISLVPASLLRVRRQLAARRIVTRAALTVLANVLALGCVYGYAVYQRSAYIAELQSRIDAVQPIADDVTSKRKQLMRLKQHLDRKGSALEILSVISDQMPGGMNITEFSYTHGEEARLRGRTGYTGSADNLAAELRRIGLESMPRLSQASTGPWRADQEYGQQVFDYEIVMPFPKDDASAQEEGEEGSDDVVE
ncbi:MAG: hypothetical protein AMXMBFR84_38680 [Candidatus Hydrogenedentota bacterium]